MKKIKYQDLEKVIFNELKKRLKRNNAVLEGDTETTPVKAPPKTTPTKKPNPLKIPKTLPGTKPAPKASLRESETRIIKKNSGFIEISNYIREAEQKIKFKRLINEAPPMNIDDPRHGEPAPNFKKGIEGLGPSPFSDIEFLQKKTLDQSTLERLGSEEFNQVVRTLLNTEKLSMMAIMTVLQSIMTIENRHKRALEDLALNSVVQNFGLPDEVVEMIKVRLAPDEDISMDSDDDSPEEEIEDVLTPQQKEIAKKYIDKRKTQNALMMGSGYRAHKLFNGIKNQIDAIDPRLFPLYEKIMPNMEFYLWTIEFPIAGRVNLGKSEIELENDEVKGSASARLFLILLHETAKIAVELLFLQGLEDIAQEHGEDVKTYVIKQSDKYEEEQWMKLIGPVLWKYLHDAINYLVHSRGDDYSIVSFLLNRIGILKPDDFLQLMDDVVNNGEVAIQKLDKMLDELDQEIQDYENQNDETPEPSDIMPDPDEAEISNLVNNALDDIMGSRTQSGVPSKLEDKSISDMTPNELKIMLSWALENEEYEKASEIRDELNKR